MRIKSKWDLVVLNPSLVFGPGLNSNATSESFSIMKSFGNGLMKRGVPNIGIGIIDVRDLADAHIEGSLYQKC